MKVKFVNDSELLYEFECDDVSGLYTALKESNFIGFDDQNYTYIGSILNYVTEKGKIEQELLINLTEWREPKKATIQPKPPFL